MKLPNSSAVRFFDVALMVVLFPFVGTIHADYWQHKNADSAQIDGPSCPTGTTCVRPLRCDAVMQLYWKNLTLAMEMGPNWEIGSPLAALPSPLDIAFQRCWIFTEASGRSHHEGVCCQLDEPRELRPSDVGYVENNALLMFDPDDDVEKEDDETQGQVTEDEQQQQLSNDIEQDWRKSNIRKSSIPDYERLIG